MRELSFLYSESNLSTSSRICNTCALRTRQSWLGTGVGGIEKELWKRMGFIG
jgi:hypothetical protein